ENPEAWLIAVARRKLVDAQRRRRSGEAAADDLRRIADELECAAAASGADIPDERLALMFACAHPAIERGVRAPLILQTILGFTAEDLSAGVPLPAATTVPRLRRPQ